MNCIFEFNLTTPQIRQVFPQKASFKSKTHIALKKEIPN